MAMGRCIRVHHKFQEGAPYSIILENTRNSDEFLLFESGVVAALKHEDCEEFKKQYVKILDAYGCLGVLQLYGADHAQSYLVLVTACISVGKIFESDVYRITGVQFLPMWSPLPRGVQLIGDDRVLEIQKLVSSGTFYFSWASSEAALIDLSLCAQKRYRGGESDARFFWNRSLYLHLLRFGIDTSHWLLRIMCGGIEIKTVYAGTKTARTCIISRLSCERAGTRFNVRGTNDYGHVANFVETEMVIFLDDQVVSFIQTRGSVPLFWEQPGVQVGAHKVKLSRGFEAAAPAYDRHMRKLKDCYGEQVIVNLLGTKEGESMLSQAFKSHHQNSPHSIDVPYIHFDYHALVRTGNRLQNLEILHKQVQQFLERFDFFYAKSAKIFKNQSGTIRTNCLDCLDRTNTVQTEFGLKILPKMLVALEIPDKFYGRFVDTYKQLWILNGDHVSRIYAGTGALEFRSKLKDASRTVTRTIQNNLMDGSKQEAIDCFLVGSGLNTDLYDRACNLLPTNLLHAKVAACPNVLAGMIEHVSDYTLQRKIRTFCGTWNVNGGLRINNIAFRNQSVADWILDIPQKSIHYNVFNEFDQSQPVDIFVIGLEEIVDLNASNIMNASTANQKMWAEELKKVICRSHKYILITSVQLVGVCLFVYVRPHLAQFIRDVGTDTVKTGLGGATGNKGGVAIRFVLHSTSFCFLCAHFAAGQSQIAERNNDFGEICKKIKFPMGRNVFSHDYIFWIGDFNYRVDMQKEEVKQLISSGNWNTMMQSEQLTQQRLAGNVFQGFNEGPIMFPPTYKYDTFSDDYDTSEKCRTPAWTDRILWWQRPKFGQNSADDSECKLLFYTRAELKTSDHRPVGALFDIMVREVDEDAREAVYHQVLSNQGPPDSTVLVNVDTSKSGSGFPMEFVDKILGKISELGIRVLLVKFVGDDMWLIFKDGESALAALSLDGVQVGNAKVAVKLKSPNWEEECSAELQQCRGDSETFHGKGNYSLLADEISKDTGDEFIQYEVDDEMEGLSVGELGRSPSPSGRTTPIPDVPTPTKSAPPPRPAPPPKRPPPIEEPKIVQVNAAPALSSLPPEFPPPALNINPPLNNYGWNDSTAESEWNAFDTGKQTGPNAGFVNYADWPQNDATAADWPQNDATAGAWPQNDVTAGAWPQNDVTAAAWPEKQSNDFAPSVATPFDDDPWKLPPEPVPAVVDRVEGPNVATGISLPPPSVPPPPVPPRVPARPMPADQPPKSVPQRRAPPVPPPSSQ